MLYLKYPNIIHTYDLEFFKVFFLQIIYIMETIIRKKNIQIEIYNIFLAFVYPTSALTLFALYLKVLCLLQLILCPRGPCPGTLVRKCHKPKL
jgi:hypothetical protein